MKPVDRTGACVSAEQMARHLIALSAAEREPTLLTQMHLHKLMYYVQGWSMAVLGRPAYSGRLEAWKHGPVETSIREVFKRFGRGAIPWTEGRRAEGLPADVASVAGWVWRRYRRYSARGLRSMTHAERPWREARGGLPDDASSRAEISVDALARGFGERYAEKCRALGVSESELAAGIAAARSGRSVPLAELVREVGGR